MSHIISYGGRIISRGGRVIVHNKPLAIGDLYGGGIVAYILQVGDPGYESGKLKGLIAATSNQGAYINWITGGATQTTLNGNTGIAIGTGAANTAAMAAQTGYTGGAAKVCLDYRGGGYSDWYLPSINELIKIITNRDTIGNFIADYYWSSTEVNSTLSRRLYYNDTTVASSTKIQPFSVRAIR